MLLGTSRLQIDTLGDSLVAACGVLTPDEDGFHVVDQEHSPEESARRVFAFAQDIVRVAAQVRGRVGVGDVCWYRGKGVAGVGVPLSRPARPACACRQGPDPC